MWEACQQMQLEGGGDTLLHTVNLLSHTPAQHPILLYCITLPLICACAHIRIQCSACYCTVQLTEAVAAWNSSPQHCSGPHRILNLHSVTPFRHTRLFQHGLSQNIPYWSCKVSRMQYLPVYAVCGTKNVLHRMLLMALTILPVHCSARL